MTRKKTNGGQPRPASSGTSRAGPTPTTSERPATLGLMRQQPILISSLKALSEYEVTLTNELPAAPTVRSHLKERQWRSYTLVCNPSGHWTMFGPGANLPELTTPETAVDLITELWVALLGAVSANFFTRDEVTIDMPHLAPTFAKGFGALPVSDREEDASRLKISLSMVMQQFSLVHSEVWPKLFPYTATTTVLKHPDPIPERSVVRRHPIRPPRTFGVLYSRVVPHIGPFTLFNLRPVAENDASTLMKWMNDPRVDAWWGEASNDAAKHVKFVKDRINDKHTTTVIGSFVEIDKNDVHKYNPAEQDAIYSEIYWVLEDRLGVKMEEAGFTVDAYDRGIHQLVGSNAHRGPHRVRAWLPSLVHYCFISDPRTRAVWCEPNEKNAKMVAYLCGVGFERVGTIYFSHKTSALMKVTRERFFELCPF